MDNLCVYPDRGLTMPQMEPAAGSILANAEAAVLDETALDRGTLAVRAQAIGFGARKAIICRSPPGAYILSLHDAPETGCNSPHGHGERQVWGQTV